MTVLWTLPDDHLHTTWRRASYSCQSTIAYVFRWCKCDLTTIRQLPSLLLSIQWLSFSQSTPPTNATTQPHRRPAVISHPFPNLPVQEQPRWFSSMCQRSEGAAGSFIAAHNPARAKRRHSRARQGRCSTFTRRNVHRLADTCVTKKCCNTSGTEAFQRLDQQWL